MVLGSCDKKRETGTSVVRWVVIWNVIFGWVALGFHFEMRLI
jgi:hypothetical protein